jgi:adenosine deaminase
MPVEPEFIRGLPKVELHVHLEGTLEPELMFALAARNGVTLPYESVGQLRAAYNFAGLEDFLRLLVQGADVLRRGADFYDLTLEYLSRAHSDSVRRTEMYFGPQTWLDAGIPIAEQFDGIFAAIADAQSQWGIDSALILAAQRHRTEATALELLDLAAPWADQIIAVGLGAAERGNPPGKFARYYAEARRRGFRTTIHAGEEGPAAHITEALDLCRPERIDHGVTAARDPSLVDRLAQAQIPLTMCPLSNLALRVVPSLAAHPLLALHEAGVLVTVNSDDPPYFGGYVNDNYAAVTGALGLTRAQLTALAANSVHASFAGDSAKAAPLAELDDYAASPARGQLQ